MKITFKLTFKLLGFMLAAVAAFLGFVLRVFIETMASEDDDTSLMNNQSNRCGFGKVKNYQTSKFDSGYTAGGIYDLE